MEIVNVYIIRDPTTGLIHRHYNPDPNSLIKIYQRKQDAKSAITNKLNDIKYWAPGKATDFWKNAEVVECQLEIPELYLHR